MLFEAFRFPGSSEVALSVALVLSLVLAGGFALAMRRGSRFYLAEQQPRLARWWCGYLLRAGSAIAVVLALAGAAAGWFFNLGSWPYLTLLADEFIVLSVACLTCVVISRGGRRPVAIALAASAMAFVAVRVSGWDALVAQLAASGAFIAASLTQMRSVFNVPKAASAEPIALPRASVRLYNALPFFAAGSLFFAFLFADRLLGSRSVAIAAGGLFRAGTDAKAGLDIAFLAFIGAGAAVAYGHRLLTTRFARSAQQPYDGDREALRRRCRRSHRIALSATIAGSAALAALVALAMNGMLPAATDRVWATMIAANSAYLLLAVGLLNAWILSSLDRRAPAVRALAIALLINVAVGFATNRIFGIDVATAGLAAGAAYLAIHTTLAFSAALRRPDYALARLRSVRSV